MREYELAWRWFLDKYGLMIDSDIKIEDETGSIVMWQGSNEIRIVFPVLNHANSSVITLEGFNIHARFIGRVVNMGNNSVPVIFIRSNNGKIPCGFIKNRELILNFDPFAFIYHTLSGNLELNLPSRVYLSMVERPFLDNLSEIIFRCIKYLFINNDCKFLIKPFWPNGNRFAVCLTHDVDEIRKTYQYITRTIKFLKRFDLKGLKNELFSLMSKLKGKDPYWTFEDIVKLERELNVRSTFFFLKETGKISLLDRTTWRHLGRRYDFRDPKVSEIIKKLHSEGWEVGLHGSFYSYSNYDLLKKEKQELENVLGDRVIGIRQHNLNLSIPETWRIHEALGFEYDTTLGSNHYVGFRWGTCFPFYPIDGDRFLNVLEIPLIIEDIVLFRYRDPWKKFLDIVNEVKRCGGVLTILWHHSVFNDLDFPGWADMYRRMIECCKKEGAWITNACDIAIWWKKRVSLYGNKN